MSIHLHLAGAVLSLVGAGSSEENPTSLETADTRLPTVEDPSEPGFLNITLAEDVTVKVGGRLFYDWGWFTGDSPTYNTEPTPGGTTAELEDGTEFRAARLFAEGTLPGKLKLVDSKVSTTGVTIATYEPAGEIVPGSFG